MPSQKRIRINEKYIGTYSLDNIYEEPSFIKLCKKISNDTTLRDFFLRNKFKDHFDIAKPNLLSSFIYKMSLFPSIAKRYPGRNFLCFFSLMRQESDTVFYKKLHKSTSDICDSAKDIGLFVPETHILSAEGKIHLIPIEACADEVPIAIFYRICDSLRELWIKNEEKGKMLEVWIYELLKEYLDREDREIIYSIQIEEAIDKPMFSSFKEFSKEVGIAKDNEDIYNDVPNQDHITQIDTSIIINGKIKIIIECKTNADWEVVFKLRGVMNLLDVPYGVLIIGNKVNQFPDVREFENIKIFNDVINSHDFPQSLKTHLDGLLSGLSTS